MSLFFLLFLITGSIAQVAPVLQYNISFVNVTGYSSTFYSNQNTLRISWVSQSIAYMATSTDLGQNWTVLFYSGIYTQIKVEQEYIALFNGSLIQLFYGPVLIGTIKSDGEFALSSDKNGSILLVYLYQNITLSQIYNGNWSTVSSLGFKGTSPALTSGKTLEWDLDLVSGAQYHLSWRNNWSSPVEVNVSAVPISYSPSLVQSATGLVEKLAPGIIDGITVKSDATLYAYNQYRIFISDRLYYSSGAIWSSFPLPGVNCTGISMEGIGLGLLCDGIFQIWNLSTISSTVLTYPVVINQSIIFTGDLVFLNTSVLTITGGVLISVNGTVTFGGGLHVVNPVAGTLFKYNSSNGTFSDVQMDPCYKLDYGASELMVLYQCQNFDWIIIVVPIICAIVLIAVVVIMVRFRKKVFPFAHRKKWTPQITIHKS